MYDVEGLSAHEFQLLPGLTTNLDCQNENETPKILGYYALYEAVYILVNYCLVRSFMDRSNTSLYAIGCKEHFDVTVTAIKPMIAILRTKM